MSRLSAERGLSLIELVIAMTVMLAILGATLAALSSFERTTHKNQELNDAQENVRSTMDQLARELRNHASSTPELLVGIDHANQWDIVFQTIGPAKPATSANSRNLMRVRYCLSDPASGRATLWKQWQTWETAVPPAAPSTSGCPNAAWPQERAMTGNVTNRLNGGRPVFCPVIRGNGACSVDDTQLDEVTRVRMALYLDVNGPTERPNEAKLESGISLRNKNNPPVPRFTLETSGNHILLNAAETIDPEGDRIRYEWLNGSTVVATGPTLDWLPGPGSYSITLRATDAAGLQATSEPQAVTIQ